jgi:hypothetical protein
LGFSAATQHSGVVITSGFAWTTCTIGVLGSAITGTTALGGAITGATTLGGAITGATVLGGATTGTTALGGAAAPTAGRFQSLAMSFGVRAATTSIRAGCDDDGDSVMARVFSGSLGSGVLGALVSLGSTTVFGSALLTEATFGWTVLTDATFGSGLQIDTTFGSEL